MEAAQRLEGGDVVCRLLLVERGERSASKGGRGKKSVYDVCGLQDMQQQKAISGLQRW